MLLLDLVFSFNNRFFQSLIFVAFKYLEVHHIFKSFIFFMLFKEDPVVII